MASVLDICNLALSQLGDSATVSSINPPEGSAQADHCARFYPLARDSLLEMHDWSFATRRALLVQLDNTVTQWAYCYAAPSDMLNPIAVLDSTATDDLATVLQPTDPWLSAVPGYGGTPLVAAPAPQPYVLERNDDGAEVVRTNQAAALLRYTARVTDPTRFSPLFARALAASLSSMLAGPLLKGEAGAAAALRWQVVAFGQDGRSGWFGRAAASDAGQKRDPVRDHHQVAWLAGR